MSKKITVFDSHGRLMSDQRCEECPTRGACVASYLDPHERATLPSHLVCSDPISEGTHLFRAGDPVELQFHIRSGFIKTYSISAEGDEWVTGFYLPGDVLGFVQQDGLHTESAVTLETSSACLLNEEDLGKNAQLTRGLMRHLGEKSRAQLSPVQ